MKDLDREYTFVGELGEDLSSLSFNSIRALHKSLRTLLGTKLEVTFRPLKYMKSHAQLRWLWGVAYKMISHYLKETSGERYTTLQVHEFCTQHIMNEGNSGYSIVFTEEEFEALISDIETGAFKRSDYESLGNRCKARCSVVHIMGERVVSLADYKRLSKSTVKEFNNYKEQLQKAWAEMGLEIPDPRGNSLLEDYLTDT